MNKEAKQNVESQISSLVNKMYSIGYTDGRNYTKEQYNNIRGITHVRRATEEEIERFGSELHGWCDCGRPIEGRWVGGITFCPWCGKMIQWNDNK